MDKQFISIIIPTYNRKNTLAGCIDSIIKQNYPASGFELIIVNDESSDGTYEFVNEYIKRLPFKSRVINQKHLGPSIARNKAIDESRGPIIAFTEDDVILDENWLSKGSRHFNNDEISAVEGVTKYLNTQKPIRRLEKQYQLGFLPLNIMYRKDIFIKIGGYDPSFYEEKLNTYFREDIELGFRLLSSGQKAIIDPEMVVYHPKQYQTIKGAYDHAKRYYFDPLLYKKHPALFRQRIESKKIGLFRFQRPLHYLSLASLLLFILTIFNLKFGILFLLTNTGYCVKYEIKNPLDYFKLLPLPFFYLWYFLKGCFKFKSYKAII